ncbi:cell surface glycoprotein CD200 receptor 1-B-like isoform X2 [Leuresthes tenuis]|uniref:cell surface glycoprotein CD200 receptor 1-B-like isoform X2 n=1 Tax=Leuresthes tenuis TaxID=355514 RepID=UPI003B51505A
MRAIMWIYVCIIFLSETWSLHSVHRNAAFNLGSDAYLNCSDKTWSETMYVIWNIEVNNKSCKIALSNDGEGKNTCNDGKSLRNTSSGQSFLHIPGFSADDVGVYKCESAFKGGSENYDIDVTLTVSPNISAWLKYKDNKMVAVCRAERGNPPANISWSHTGNLETVKTLNDSNGFVTVESYLELPESVTPENLSCIVRHMSWNQEKTLVPELKKGQSSEYKTE